MPFSQDKPRMSHSADRLIGNTTYHSPQPQPPPMNGTPQYSSTYGVTSYYPPPPYQQPYPVAIPPPISGPQLAPEYIHLYKQVMVPTLPQLIL
jgi:hypothetical protein